MRAGFLEAERELVSSYRNKPIADVLRMAEKRARPFHVDPSFSDASISNAIARSRSRANLLTSVRRPLWRYLWPWGADEISILHQPLPTQEWSGHLVLIVSSSGRVDRMIANLARALQLVGSDPDQLVTSLEEKIATGGRYCSVIACIPGSS